jgi:hypothetical protein
MMKFLLTLSVLLSGCSNDPALAYTDDQLIMAIYYAEGGAAAEYPFGIRSVHCGSYANCKAICETTVKHNHQRFERFGHKRFKTYLDYLASRYCPCSGRTLTAAEKRLNRFWLKNVKSQLRRLYAKR